MVTVTVEPTSFTMVDFDAGHIARLVQGIADEVGLADGAEVRIEVDERTPLGRTRVTSLDPVTITAESGAFEDAKRPRQLSDESVANVVGRLLFRARDRLDPAFGEPPADVDLPPAEYVAWDTYAVGRCERLGHPAQRERRRYHFRIRHGFTDRSDAVFDRLWDAEGLTWADVQAASAEAAAGGRPGRSMKPAS